jgi:hypothetical protein
LFYAIRREELFKHPNLEAEYAGTHNLGCDSCPLYSSWFELTVSQLEHASEPEEQQRFIRMNFLSCSNNGYLCWLAVLIHSLLRIDPADRDPEVTKTLLAKLEAYKPGG